MKHSKHNTTFLLIALIIAVLCLHCNTEFDPLKDAVFPCTCLFENQKNNVQRWQCQDKDYYFIKKEYCNKYNENDVIDKPLISK